MIADDADEPEFPTRRRLLSIDKRGEMSSLALNESNKIISHNFETNSNKFFSVRYVIYGPIVRIYMKMSSIN